METTTERKFYGPHQVQFITILDDKTPAGGDVYEVHLVDQLGVRIIPKRTFDALATREPITADDLQRNRFALISKPMVDILAEYDVEMLEVQSLVKRVEIEIYSMYDRATSFLWTGDDTKSVKGYESLQDRTIREINTVLNKIPKTDGQEETKIV